MSVETLPEYPNLFTLPIDEIKIIEEKCIKCGHLDKNITLLEQISLDKKVLDAYNLTKEDIYRNHHNMNLKFNNLDKFDAFTNQNHGDHHVPLFAVLPPGFGRIWCCNYACTNEIELNDKKLRITLYIWNGAEQCEIEKHFSTQYNSHEIKYGCYERGDRDWFVTNLRTNDKIWIPDLLPSQVGMFGFFQSHSSAYRLDPEQYIKVFGLKNKVEPLPLIKNIVWSNPCVQKNHYLYNAEIIKEDRNEMYDALLIQKGSKMRLFVHFYYCKDILKMHYESSTINIFDKSVEIDTIFNFNDYLSYNESEQFKLAEGDDTCKIKYKMQMQTEANLNRRVNVIYSTKYPCKYEKQIVNFETNTAREINRFADVLLIKKLVIPHSVNLRNIESLAIKIGGVNIWVIPFHIILLHSKISYSDKNIIINIPKSIYTNDLNTKEYQSDINDTYDVKLAKNFINNQKFIGLICLKLQYHQVYITLNSQDIFTFDIVLKFIECTSDVRRTLAMQGYESSIVTYNNFIFSQKKELKISIHEDCETFLIHTKNKKLDSLLINLKTEHIVYKKDYLNEISYYWCNNNKLIPYIYVQDAMYEVLRNYLPEELVYCIEYYLLNDVQYYYNIPCHWITKDYSKKRMPDFFDYMPDKLIHMNLIFDKKVDVDISIINYNRLIFAGGMAGLAFMHNHKIE